MVRFTRLEGHGELRWSLLSFGLSLGFGLGSCVSRWLACRRGIGITIRQGTLEEVAALSKAPIDSRGDLRRQSLGVMLVTISFVTFPQHVLCTNGLELSLRSNRYMLVHDQNP